MLYVTEFTERPQEIEIVPLPDDILQIYMRKDIKEVTKEDGQGATTVFECLEAYGESETFVTLENVQNNFTKYFNVMSCWVNDFNERKNAYIQAVQQMMDARAQAKGYDNIATACTYVNSTDETFKAEAERYVAWRDNVWRTCYGILDEIVQGKREKLPTVEEVLAELPMLLEV